MTATVELEQIVDVSHHGIGSRIYSWSCCIYGLTACARREHVLSAGRVRREAAPVFAPTVMRRLCAAVQEAQVSVWWGDELQVCRGHTAPCFKICAVSQFRVCVLWRTRPLRSSKASPSELIWMVRTIERDDLRHAMSPFSLFLSSFSGRRRLLGYVRPQRIVAVLSLHGVIGL